MPRGFLVKRQKQYTAYSWRKHQGQQVPPTEEDCRASDSGSEHEIPLSGYPCFGSPDSGIAHSPVSITYSDADTQNGNVLLDNANTGTTTTTTTTNNNNVTTTPGGTTTTPHSSPGLPLSISTSAYGSPFYFSAFDRLTVSSPGRGPGFLPSPGYLATNSSHSNSSSPNGLSPNKKRVNDKCEHKQKSAKKPKAARKINFEELDKTSPVSGTIIKDWSDSEDEGIRVVSGDIDSTLNLVEVTAEARAELDKIENKLGAYICQLCKEHYEDAFQLAQHRCSRIVHVEYRCPECDKVFSCPANLASHRRWHKPRPNGTGNKSASKENRAVNAEQSVMGDIKRERYQCEPQNLSMAPVQRTEVPSQDGDGLFECETCGKKFRRQAYLRKHVATHSEDRPYPCQYCSKVLRSEASRAKHLLQHTLGAQDFPCAVCAAVFPSKNTLERHQRIHTSEAFGCKYCSSIFYSSPGLTRHINKCHPTESRQVILLQMPTLNRPC